MNINDFLGQVKMIAVNILKAVFPVIIILIIVDMLFGTKMNILPSVLKYLLKVGITKDHIAVMVFITFGVWLVKKPWFKFVDLMECFFRWIADLWML